MRPAIDRKCQWRTIVTNDLHTMSNIIMLCDYGCYRYKRIDAHTLKVFLTEWAFKKLCMKVGIPYYQNEISEEERRYLDEKIGAC